MAEEWLNLSDSAVMRLGFRVRAHRRVRLILMMEQAASDPSATLSTTGRRRSQPRLTRKLKITMVQAEAQHRDHAIIEPVFSDVADGPLAHMPSGDSSANAAWITLAAITQNLLRAAGPGLLVLRQGPRRHRPRGSDQGAWPPAPAVAASPCTHLSTGTPKRPAWPCTPPPGHPPPLRPDQPRHNRALRPAAAATPAPPEQTIMDRPHER